MTLSIQKGYGGRVFVSTLSGTLAAQKGYGGRVAVWSPVAAGGGGAISGQAALTFTPAGALLGDGLLIGAASLIFTTAGDLTGSGDISGATSLTFTTTLTFPPSPTVEVIGVGGPQVTNIFLFGGVTEPPFAVQRRTS